MKNQARIDWQNLGPFYPTPNTKIGTPVTRFHMQPLLVSTAFCWRLSFHICNDTYTVNIFEIDTATLQQMAFLGWILFFSFLMRIHIWTNISISSQKQDSSDGGQNRPDTSGLWCSFVVLSVSLVTSLTCHGMQLLNCSLDPHQCRVWIKNVNNGLSKSSTR